MNDRFKEVRQLWTIDFPAARIRFEPKGKWWFKLWHRLALGKRTDLADWYWWTVAEKATEDGIVWTEPVGGDSARGRLHAPKRIWVSMGWALERPRRLLSDGTVVLLKSEQSDTVLVRRWNRSRRAFDVALPWMTIGGFMIGAASLWVALS